MIQKIVMGKGPVTKEEYDGFWNGFGIKNESEKKRIIDAMRDNFVTMQQYQQEVWSCAETAWVSRQVPQCKNAKNLIAKIKNKQSKSQGKMIQAMEKNTDNLLRASANRTEFKPEGALVGLPLTIENIRSTKININAILQRFEQVLRVRY